jgi:hypothetical protein
MRPEWPCEAREIRMAWLAAPPGTMGGSNYRERGKALSRPSGMRPGLPADGERRDTPQPPHPDSPNASMT